MPKPRPGRRAFGSGKALRVVAGTVGVCLAAGVAAYLAYLDFEPATERYPVRGIDVSHHQGRIDWGAVSKDGVAFAYIKATEGGDFVDPRFRDNWREAGRAGVARGAYNHFTLCRPAREQARNFAAVVPAVPGALPPAVDLEFVGNCAHRPPRVVLRRELSLFLDLLERKYGARPLIYVTRDFHDTYLRGALAGDRFWLRSLVREPSWRDSQWLFWQYHDRGRQAGASGPVDLNALRSDRRGRNAMLTASDHGVRRRVHAQRRDAA